MELERHQLDGRYEELRVRRRSEERLRVVESGEAIGSCPVLVVRGGERGYVVVDGFGRLRGLEGAGCEVVEAVLLEGDEGMGLVQVYQMNRGGNWSALEEGLLVKALEDLGWSCERISIALGHTASWVSRRKGLLRALPEKIQGALREGWVCAHGAERALVPLARANGDGAVELVENLSGERVGSRGLMRLYETWRDGDVETRKWVIAHPKAVLRAWRERKGEEVEEEPLLGSLAKCRNLLQSVRIRLKKGPPLAWSVEQVGRARYLLDELAGLAGQVRMILLREVEMEAGDVGCRETKGDIAAARAGLLPSQDCVGFAPGETDGDCGVAVGQYRGSCSEGQDGDVGAVFGIDKEGGRIVHGKSCASEGGTGGGGYSGEVPDPVSLRIDARSGQSTASPGGQV